MNGKGGGINVCNIWFQILEGRYHLGERRCGKEGNIKMAV
jgi:hypothetical protein